MRAMEQTRCTKTVADKKSLFVFDLGISHHKYLLIHSHLITRFTNITE